jgi:hypothetical protein
MAQSNEAVSMSFEEFNTLQTQLLTLKQEKYENMERANKRNQGNLFNIMSDLLIIVKLKNNVSFR